MYIEARGKPRVLYHPPFLFFNFLFCDRVPCWLKTHRVVWGWEGWSATSKNSSVSLTLGLQVCTTMPGFYCIALELNLAPHAWKQPLNHMNPLPNPKASTSYVYKGRKGGREEHTFTQKKYSKQNKKCIFMTTTVFLSIQAKWAWH